MQNLWNHKLIIDITSWLERIQWPPFWYGDIIYTMYTHTDICIKHARTTYLCLQWTPSQMIGCWSFTSWQHLRSYKNRYRPVTVCTHGDFIVQSYWKIINQSFPYPINAERHAMKQQVSISFFKWFGLTGDGTHTWDIGWIKPVNSISQLSLLSKLFSVFFNDFQ